MPADGNVKSAWNGLFAVAYSLGLKGRFGVETVRGEDGTVALVGEAHDPALAEARAALST